MLEPQIDSLCRTLYARIIRLIGIALDFRLPQRQLPLRRRGVTAAGAERNSVNKLFIVFLLFSVIIVRSESVIESDSRFLESPVCDRS